MAMSAPIAFVGSKSVSGVVSVTTETDQYLGKRTVMDYPRHVRTKVALS